jgi:hypothetical protein
MPSVRLMSLSDEWEREKIEEDGQVLSDALPSTRSMKMLVLQMQFRVVQYMTDVHSNCLVVSSKLRLKIVKVTRYTPD